MKIFLTIFIIISAFIFASFIYPERCAKPIASSIKVFYDIKSLTTVVKKYKKDVGYLPKSLEDLKPKFVKRYPADSWGNEYIYELLDGGFRIYSLGSDAKVGGKGAAADTDIDDNLDSIIGSVYKPIWGCNA